MTVVHETVRLLVAPPGSLVYHLLVLFSLEAILGIAVGAWQRRRDGGTERVSGIFVGAAVGMLLARLILISLALAGFSQTHSAEMVVPPVERALNTATTLLLVWALLPWGRRRDVSWLFPASGLLLIAFAVALSLPTWQRGLVADPALVYNGSLQETVWIVAQLVLLGLGVVSLLWRRDREFGLLLSILLVLVAGHVVQLLMPDLDVHIAGWERLAQLIAFPLLAVTIYRRVIVGLSLRTQALEAVSQDSLSQIAGLISLIESGQRTVASLDMGQVMARAVREVVLLLKVDICALVFPVDRAQDKANLAATYSPHSQGSANVIQFSLAEHPALEHALKRKKKITIDAATDNTQLKRLYVLMGSIGVGPLLIQPLLYDKRVIGALLLGNDTSQQRFTTSQEKLCQALSHQVAVAIENARRYQISQAEREALKAQGEQRQKEYRRVRAALKAQLQQSQDDATQFARRLDEATAYIKREQHSSGSLAKQFQEAEEERVRLEAEVNQARQRIQSLQEQAAQVSNSHASLEAQLAQSRAQVSQMTDRLRQQPSRTSLADTVLDELSIGLVIADENGLVELVNGAAEKLLAQPIDQLLGGPIGQVYDDVRWREGISRLLDDQVDGSESGPDISLTIDRRGNPLTVEMCALRGEDGELAAIMAVLGEPAETAEIQQARDKFLGALAQELRTPMTSITGYTDLLLSESVGIIGEMQRKFLQRIKANIERMGSMLNDLIGVTAIDSGELYLEPEPIDVGTAIQEAIAAARAQLEERDLSLQLDLEQGLGAIEADPNAFQQVVSNLISNACKASPVGTEIGIKASYVADAQSTDPPRLVISVTDSAGGIAPEDQPRVFDRFYRAEQALIAGLGETGVGLSIVKALVEAHGGHVWVESEMGQGSAFAFALPVTATRPNVSSENELLSSLGG
jgi:signal transduction histidine kinase/GAF domain-containing protein